MKFNYPLFLVFVLLYASCKPKPFHFRELSFTPGEQLSETSQKIELDVCPDCNTKDTIVYWTSFRPIAIRSTRNYESCTLYLNYGAKSEKLGSISLIYLFNRKASALDMDDIIHETPLIRKMKAGRYKSNADGVSTAIWTAQNNYYTVHVSIQKR